MWVNRDLDYQWHQVTGKIFENIPMLGGHKGSILQAFSSKKMKKRSGMNGTNKRKQNLKTKEQITGLLIT